jgi:tRNA(Ile)-lysidine synthase
MMSRELSALSLRQKRFVLSVSGGRDSICLLHLFQFFREKLELEIIVFHVNFRLRGDESQRDEDFVRRLCSDMNLPCFVYRPDRVQTLSQQQARQIRLDVARPLWPDAFLVEAHHLDDQVESFLFRLFRGTGLSGLRGMSALSEREGRSVYRPLLQVARSQIDAYVKQKKISFCEDRTNSEDLYSRNWIRNKLIRKLLKRFENFKTAILRLQSQISEEEAYFEEECRKIHQSIFTADAGLELRPLRSLPLALLRRYLVFFFREVYGIPLDRSQIVELTQLILWERPFTWNAPRNLVVRVGRSARLKITQSAGRSPNRQKTHKVSS